MSARKMKRKPLIAVIGSPTGEPAPNYRSTDPSGTRHARYCLHGYQIAVLDDENGNSVFQDDVWKKRIARSRLMMILQDAPIGLVNLVTSFAQKSHVKILIDPVPMMELTEKIRRAAELIPPRSSRYQNGRTRTKKWRRRKQ